MSKRGAASFLAGLGTGYLNAERQKSEDARRDKKDKADEEDRALRRQEAELRMKQLTRAEEDAQTLRTAGAERAALPGTAVTTGAGDKNLYADPAQAQAVAADAAIEADMRGQDPGKVSTQAATGVVGANGTMAKGNTIETGPVDINAMNTPEAKSKRVIAALSGIDPLKAMDAQNTVTQRERETVKFTQEQKAYAKKLSDEGVFDALKAMRTGNGAGVAEAFNRSGEHKIVGEVTMTPEARDIPGVGKITTHTASFNVQMPDGSTKAVKYNSHDLGMSLMPYEKNLDMLIRGTDAENKQELNAARVALTYGRASGGTSAGGGRAKSEDDAPPSFDPMAGFDSKNAQAEATKQVDEALQGRKEPASAAERADLIAKKVFALQDAYGQENTRRFAASAVITALNASKSDPAAYAATYAKALQITDAATLAKRGFPAPAPAQPAAAPTAPAAATSAAAQGTGAPAAAQAAAPAPAAPAPAAPAPAAPAAPAVSPLAAAFGMTAQGGAMNAALAINLPRAEAAAAAIQTAKTNLAAAARSQDPKAMALYARELQAARAGIDALTKDMQPAQLARVRAAAGY